jgi:hypothetical protein
VCSHSEKAETLLQREREREREKWGVVKAELHVLCVFIQCVHELLAGTTVSSEGGEAADAVTTST